MTWKRFFLGWAERRRQRLADEAARAREENDAARAASERQIRSALDGVQTRRLQARLEAEYEASQAGQPSRVVLGDEAGDLPRGRGWYPGGTPLPDTLTTRGLPQPEDFDAVMA